MQQEASQRATDGLQPECSDAEEFQAEGRRGGKVPGGREGGTERGGRVALVVCCQRGLLHEKGRARDRSTTSDISTLTFLLGCKR